jgi:hypothetical protein
VHVDGRILRSARELLLAPGALTAAHLAGRRQPYVAPFQLFLVMNLIFFITQSLTGLNILSVQLSHYFAADGYGAFAQQRVTEHLAQSGSTLEVYACSPLLSATATAVLSVAVVLLLRVYRLILFCATLLTT